MEIKQEEESIEAKNKKIKIDYNNCQQWKELLSAVQEGNLGKVKEMIDYLENNSGQNIASIIKAVNEKNYKSGKYDSSVLLLAIQTRNVEIVELLLKNGIFPESEYIQDTLLHEAIKIDDLSIIHKLIEYGGCLELDCIHGVPPLFQSVALRRLNFIQLYYEKEISFEGKTKNGVPLLHFALSQRRTNKELCRLLLRYGASLSLRNNEDLTPLHYLITRPVDASTKKKLKLLLKYGSDVNAWSTKKKETVLHTAVKNGNSDAAELLIMFGADINIKDCGNYTAFKHCIRKYVHKNRNGEIDRRKACMNICFFLREILRLQALDKYIDEQIINLLKDVKHTYAICVLGAEEEYNTKIAQDVNLLEILMANENKLTTCLKNTEIRKILESQKMSCGDVWKEIFKFQVKKGKERIILLDKCQEPFKKALKWEAPLLVMDKIFSYLSRTDLRSLYAACDPENFMGKLIPKADKSEESDEDESDEIEGSDESDENDEACNIQ